MIKTVDIGNGIHYPKTIYEGRKSKISKAVRNRFPSHADQAAKYTEWLSQNFSRSERFLYYVGKNEEGWCIWKNKHGFERRIRVVVCEGEEVFESKEFKNGIFLGAPLYLKWTDEDLKKMQDINNGA